MFLRKLSKAARRTKSVRRRPKLSFDNLEERRLLAADAPDFNGDGFDDMAIGVPGEAVGSIQDAGAVNVVYGAAAGLSTSGDQIWHQDSPGVLGAAERGDYFGDSLTWGDFNGDGYDDLAIGVPGEDVGSATDAGSVNVLYGSANGLTATGDDSWHQDTAGVEGAAEAGDQFGSALTSGDFNNDGFDDLAIGVPNESVDGVNVAGAVNLLFGSASGLTASGDRLIHQNRAGMTGSAEFGDAFGRSLASGDFDGDGRDDLVVGVPLEDIFSIENAGIVHVLYGADPQQSETWHQDIEGIVDVAEREDEFARTLAVGDFDGDGVDDLAIGVADEDVGAVIDAGAVNVIYGSDNGLTAAGNQIWHQDTPGVREVAAQLDRFGDSLTAGDFDGDGRDDLAIGVALEDVGNLIDAGAVHVLYGSASGLTAAGDQVWHQDSDGVIGQANAYDHFGAAVTAADYNGDGYADLAVGVPREDIGGMANAGVVQVLRGSSGGVTSALDMLLHQDTSGINGVAEQFDNLGSSLA